MAKDGLLQVFVTGHRVEEGGRKRCITSLYGCIPEVMLAMARINHKAIGSCKGAGNVVTVTVRIYHKEEGAFTGRPLADFATYILLFQKKNKKKVREKLILK